MVLRPQTADTCCGRQMSYCHSELGHGERSQFGLSWSRPTLSPLGATRTTLNTHNEGQLTGHSTQIMMASTAAHLSYLSFHVTGPTILLHGIYTEWLPTEPGRAAYQTWLPFHNVYAFTINSQHGPDMTAELTK